MVSSSDIERRHREAIRAELGRQFAEEREIRAKQGLFPFECRWVRLEEIDGAQHHLKRKDREMSLELALVLAGMLLMLLLLSLLCYAIVK